MNPLLLQLGMMNNSVPQQQEEQMNPYPNTGSPGNLSAMHYARQSLAMDEAQKKRAQGLAMMKFFSNMAKPGHGNGLAGTLSAVNSSFEPAIDAYLAEEGRALSQNEAAAKYLMGIQKQQMDQQELQERMRHNRASESLTRDSNRFRYEDQASEHAEKQAAKEEANRIFKETGDKVRPVISLTPSLQKTIADRHQRYLNSANSAEEGLDAIKNLRKIAEESPKIFNGFRYIAESLSQKDSQSYLKRAAANLGLKGKDKDNFYRAGMYAKTIYFKNLESTNIGAKAMNMFVEKMMSHATPNLQWPKDAFLSALDKDEESYQYSKDEFGKGANYAQINMDYFPKTKAQWKKQRFSNLQKENQFLRKQNDDLMKADEVMATEAQPEVNRDELLNQIISQYPEHKEQIMAYPEDAIRDYLKANGK